MTHYELSKLIVELYNLANERGNHIVPYIIIMAILKILFLSFTSFSDLSRTFKYVTTYVKAM